MSGVTELRERGVAYVNKECGQAAGTFMPENAAAMLACVPGWGASWSIHPTVKRDLYMWGVWYKSSPFEPPSHGDEDGKLFGLPIHFDEDRLPIGTEGDVVLLCEIGSVLLRMRD